MSQSIFHHTVLCQTQTVAEHQSKVSSFAVCVHKGKNPSLSTNFRGNNRLCVRKRRLAMGKHRHVDAIPRAVLTTNPASDVSVSSSVSGAATQVDIKVSYSSSSLLLHWGVVRDQPGKWVLPSRQPDGTKVYKNRALRTPFTKYRFKNNGENFHIKLSVKNKLSQEVSVPEDLVQIQAYLRWERKGKQTYSPEQEKEEYEAARRELLEEVARGTSVQDLHARLTNKNNPADVKEPSVSKAKKNSVSEAKKPSVSEAKSIPDELVQIQAYIRWEKAGKPNYSQEQQLMEFEEARKELLAELEKGVSLDEIRKKIIKGEIQTKVAKQLKTKKYFRAERIQRKKRDLMQLINRTVAENTVVQFVDAPKALTVIENYANAREEYESGLVLNMAIFKLGNDSLLVLITKDAGKIKVHLATDSKDPFTLHWALSRTSEEWLVPPATALPPGSVTMNEAAETPFKAGSSSHPSYEVSISINLKIFNIASDLISEAINAGQLGLAGLLVWMRFMATRQLIWNKNYNVKPREISKAQDRLTDLLQDVYASYPQYREIVRMILSTVGRGGEGDVGQRIRDEILVIQRNNDCKGGMMEEWHQKLHNNTSPDDVVICQALIDYISSDFDIGVYWKILNDNGITKERLLSYDRAIHSEPNFRRDQKEGLLRDLGNYMRTLKAVHSGADLESAISNCMGYKAEGQGFMVGVKINPVPGLPTGFPGLLEFILEHIEDKNVEPLLEGLLEARQELQPSLRKSQSRLKDLIFLDLALDSTVRTAVERGYEELNNVGPEKLMYSISLVLENLALSSDDNEDLIYCLKGWDLALSMCKSNDTHWALYAKSVLDRTRLALTDKAHLYQQILQPSAEYLGSLLGVDRWAVEIFTEEIIRAGSAASLSTLLNRLDPVLRKTANLGSWQVISPVETVGYVEVVDELLAVQNKSYEQPTILIAKSVKGEEEIPDGTVAILTPDMPDVLSHVSVRARNSKGEFIDDKSTHLKDDGSVTPISLAKKKFSGRYAVSSEEFTSELVGAKSRNISYLKGKLSSWIGIPTSVALPFGVFEHILSDKSNEVVQVGELKTKMKSSGMPWPGDEGEQRWEQAWRAIKKVWGSKWNERAYFSTRKVKLDHDYLSMAVLVQEVINADYAFVIHTTNPSSGDSSEIYAEVVKGLGETLVGAYPGRALSFICKKRDLNSPQVLGYPSKPVGLFIRRSIIFRSDSNGEDLEGYAGAGLYDR
ncbi:hypothetical protein Fmac_005652 [Flemingia macrophylla]|uniref:Pyruvate phosphate dikinase AMP/ATP-binding domain-containing protein n=1 Tax=Flemingia macrophylla TaxID=520843 RepID=A0ABD1N8D5_9FABA